MGNTKFSDYCNSAALPYNESFKIKIIIDHFRLTPCYNEAFKMKIIIDLKMECELFGHVDIKILEGFL